MYELKSGSAILRLREDLELLELEKGTQRFVDNAPFQFTCVGGLPITAKNIKNKTVTATESEISVEFSGFVFNARWLGNTYCRPNPEYTPELRVTVTFRFDGEDLIVGISSIDNIAKCSMQVLVAQGLMNGSSQSKGELYLPIDYGMRFDFPRNDIFWRGFEASSSWSLPVHGFFTPEGGLGLWCEDASRDYVVGYNHDRAGTVFARCRQLFDAEENEPREMRFMMFDAGSDFRALATRCRELRIASGRFKTLVQKGEERPVVNELPGTVFWKHNVYYKARPEGIEKTWSLYVARSNWNETEGMPNNWTAPEVFGTAKENGFDRVAICNTGWNRDGFDAGYPNRFPVNPERGTEEDFREAVKNAKALSSGYLLNVHDNYIDAYESDGFIADEMLQTTPGVPVKGSIWRGGQSYRICATNGLKYAKRDLPILADITGPSCIYIDVYACVPLRTCRAKDHPLNKRQNWETNREICKFAQNTIGALAVEGCGTDMYADVVDIGGYGGLHYSGFPVRADGPVPVPVPLWQMVYHDCVLNYFGEGYSPVHGKEYQLYQALYTLLPTNFDEHSKRISYELRSAYTAQLVNFEDIEPRKVVIENDGSYRTSGVSRSVYSDGTEVIANFNDEPYVYGDKTVPARDFIICK